MVVQRGQVTLHQNEAGHPITSTGCPAFFMSRVDDRDERLLLGTVVALTATNKVCHTNAQHRASSNPSESHTVKTGEREVGALLVLDGEGDSAVINARLVNKVDIRFADRNSQLVLPFVLLETIGRPTLAASIISLTLTFS